MRPTTLAIVAASLLPFGCDSGKAKKKEAAPPPNQEVQIAPKKTVPQNELPPLAADPGGATGKAVWQAGFGGLGTDAVRSISVSSDGSTYVTGYYEGEVNFGGEAGKKPSAGKTDAFLAKYGTDGKLAWAQTWGAARDDAANAIAIKGDKIAVAGQFLDEIKIGTFAKKANGSDDLFIVAFDKAGTPEWLWTAGGIDSDGVNAIAATPDGGWVIGGSFTDSLEITTGAGKANVKSKGGTDALLIKLAATGDTEWVKTFGGRFDDTFLHVAVDANSNVFVQGVFKDVADFGGKDQLKAGGGSDNDVVLAKYDTNGDHVWSQRFGNSFNEVAGGLALAPDGSITISGSFENKGSISFGPGDDHSSLGEADVYVARFGNDGKLMWAKSFGGDRVDVANDVVVDHNGNSIVTGWFEGSADFGKGVQNSKTTNKDTFVLKLDAKGATTWIQTFGDKDHDQGRAIAVDDKGDIYVTGLYRFTLAIVGEPVKQVLDDKDPILSKAPKADVFVVKLQR